MFVSEYARREAAWESLLAWRSLLDRVEVGGVLPLRFRAEEDHLDNVRIVLRALVPDRENGRVIPIELSECVPEYLRDDLDRLRLLRSLVHRLYEHEADEQLVVTDAEGRRTRPFDPHHSESLRR